MNDKQDSYAAMIREAIRQHPPMPAMVKQVMLELRNPEVNYAQLADRMRMDPGVTMNVLKLANSSAFVGTRQVDSLQQAFVRLGTRRLFQIVLAQNVAGRLAARLDGYELEPGALLRHSLCVALTAESLAKRLKLSFSETVFTAGLLHDMGKLVMDRFLVAAKPLVRKKLDESADPFDRIEHALFNIAHPDAGALLMETWQFPSDLVEIVRLHHHPTDSSTFGNAALIVHWADTLSYSQGFGDGVDGFRYEVFGQADKMLGLGPKDVERIASETLEKIKEMEDILTGTKK